MKYVVFNINALSVVAASPYVVTEVNKKYTRVCCQPQEKNKSLYKKATFPLHKNVA